MRCTENLHLNNKQAHPFTHLGTNLQVGLHVPYVDILQQYDSLTRLGKEGRTNALNAPTNVVNENEIKLI